MSRLKAVHTENERNSSSVLAAVKAKIRTLPVTHLRDGNEMNRFPLKRKRKCVNLSVQHTVKSNATVSGKMVSIGLAQIVKGIDLSVTSDGHKQ